MRFTTATALSYIPTDLGFARGRQEAPPVSSLLHHDDRIRHSAGGGPEGFRYPRRPPSPPDPRLDDPELLCAIGAMASASSAPPAADGLRLLTSLSLSLI